MENGFILIIDKNNNLITDINLFDTLYKNNNEITFIFKNGKYLLKNWFLFINNNYK